MTYPVQTDLNFIFAFNLEDWLRSHFRHEQKLLFWAANVRLHYLALFIEPANTFRVFSYRRPGIITHCATSIKRLFDLGILKECGKFSNDRGTCIALIKFYINLDFANFFQRLLIIAVSWINYNGFLYKSVSFKVLDVI